MPFTAGVKKRPHVFLPGRLIEISSEKPAGFVCQKWINSSRQFPGEMIMDDLIRQREVFLGLFGMGNTPNSAAGGRIARLAIVALLPAHRVNIIPPAKQAAEQLHLFFRTGL